MPLYSWHCVKCKAEAEVLRNIADYQVVPTVEETPIIKLETVCVPHESHEWKKKIGKANFKLLGGGWADTGYEKW